MKKLPGHGSNPQEAGGSSLSSVLEIRREKEALERKRREAFSASVRPAAHILAD